VAAGDVRLPRGDAGAKTREQEKRRGVEMAVSLVRRERPSDAAALCPRPQGTGGGIGPRAAPGLAARTAPRLCQPPAAQRRGPAHRADAARPYRYLDHADLYPCGRGAAEKPGARPAPAGGEIGFAATAALT